MSSTQELNCKTFYEELNVCPTSRFSGRRQRWLMNTLDFFPPLILSVRGMGYRLQGNKWYILRIHALDTSLF
jgi:hypothetical protein